MLSVVWWSLNIVGVKIMKSKIIKSSRWSLKILFFCQNNDQFLFYFFSKKKHAEESLYFPQVEKKTNAPNYT